jgi:exosortase E/protease (VPEID-CTERM system)
MPSFRNGGLGILSSHMQYVLAPAEDRVSISTAADSRLVWRIAGLFLLLCVEILLVSSQLQHFAFSEAHGLAGLLYNVGPWKIRIPVTLAVISLLFWQAKGRENMQRVQARPIGHAIQWYWIAAHAVAISLFAWLAVALLNNPPRGARLNGMIVLCLAMGAGAAVLAALSFLPAGVWREIFRGTGDAWAYVVGLGAGACVAATFAERLWYPMARWTLVLSNAMLHPFFPAVVADPVARTLGFQNFKVEVAPACSGYEGIGLILVFTTAYLWFLRREWRFPRALLLIPVGVAVIWFFNAVRIAALLLIGAAGAPDVAMQGFHSHAGWILFNLVALGSCLVARRISWLSTASGPSVGQAAETREHSAVSAYLMPFLAILGVGLLTGAASAGFEWLYAARILAAAAALWYFRESYRKLDWRAGWPALAAGALVFALWIGLERFTAAASAGTPAALVQAAPVARFGWIALRILGAVATVPIAEELAFRGFLLRRLASADFEAVAFRSFQWLPFLISSIGFGVLHGERWLAGTLAGMIYALILMRRGRMGEAVIAHATTNALLAAWVLSTGQWQLW